MDVEFAEKVGHDLQQYYEDETNGSQKQVNFLKENVRLAEHALRLPMKQYLFSENVRIHQIKSDEAIDKKNYMIKNQREQIYDKMTRW